MFQMGWNHQLEQSEKRSTKNIYTVVKVDGGFHSQKVAICKGPW